MTTIELKKILKSRIDLINDKKILTALNTFAESSTENILILSDSQKKAIKKSQKEYLKGNYYTNDQVNEEIETWLKE
jgi:predicted transcriptional regulator